MSFQEHLKEIVDRVEGSIQCVLMGIDGLAIGSFPEAAPEQADEAIGIEYTGIFREIKTIHERSQFGEPKELIVRGPEKTALFYFISDEYFLLLTLSADGNLGKARFLLKINGEKISDQL